VTAPEPCKTLRTMLSHCVAIAQVHHFLWPGESLDFSTANKLKYNVTAHATGVYNVFIYDLTGATCINMISKHAFAVRGLRQLCHAGMQCARLSGKPLTTSAHDVAVYHVHSALQDTR